MEHKKKIFVFLSISFFGNAIEGPLDLTVYL